MATPAFDSSGRAMNRTNKGSPCDIFIAKRLSENVLVLIARAHSVRPKESFSRTAASGSSDPSGGESSNFKGFFIPGN
jgi:hypothetical protein